jgi:hypothetical protein
MATILGANPALGFGRTLQVNGALTLQTPLVLDGGTLTVNSFSSGGTNLQLTRGTLNVTASNVNAGPGGAFGNGPLTLGSDMNFNVTGGGTGFTLNSGGLLVLDGGALGAPGNGITNNGEIRGQSLISLVSGTTLTNFGLIDGTARFTTSLDNRANGELRVADGERLNFQTAAAAPLNRGSISLLGGTMEFTQLLTNQLTGVISGRGTLIAHGGISNSGTIALSAGLSDVMGGMITNASASKVIVTGGSTSTFYGPVTNIAGSEFRVSTNSTAVFLGDVVGLAAFTGPGTKDFEGNASGLGINSGVGRTIVGPAGKLSAAFVRDGSLLVEGTATILLDGSPAATSLVGTLSLAGGTLDLNDNDLIATTTSKSSVEAAVAAARNFGAWDQPGITSSAARNNPNGSTGLGVLSGQEYLAMGGGSFDGFAVSPTDVLVKYTWNGDVNLNGVVNFDDYVRIDIGFNTGLSGWANGDFNYSGSVNFDDYVLIDIAFNTQSGTLKRAVDYLSGDDRSESGLAATGVRLVIDHFERFGVEYAQHFLSAVPEPSAVALVLLGSGSLRPRRRRKLYFTPAITSTTLFGDSAPSQ